MQRLTIEVILRAVFGLDRGERLERLRVLLGRMLKFAMSPIGLIPPRTPGPTPSPRWRTSRRSARQADDEIQALVDERRADAADRDDVEQMN